MTDFYESKKFCVSCDKYVQYLQSQDTEGTQRSFCVECGGKTRLLSKSDWADLEGRLVKVKHSARKRSQSDG